MREHDIKGPDRVKSSVEIHTPLNGMQLSFMFKGSTMVAIQMAFLQETPTVSTTPKL